MKYLKYITVIACILLIGCADFEEMNTDPNQPTIVSNNLLLTHALLTTNQTIHSLAYDLTSLTIQHTTNASWRDAETYYWENLGEGYWNSLYLVLNDIEQIRLLGIETENPNYEAIALILRSWTFSILTDLWGDIPYSEAIKGLSESNYTPVYDNQENIYDGILADLEKANDLIDPSIFFEGDIVYNGNADSWKKLANSLRIRYLMRISNKKDVSSELNAILNNPDKYPIFEDENDDAGMKYSTEFPNQFPYVTHRESEKINKRLAKPLVDTMNRFADERLPIIGRFAEDTTVYIGRVPGSLLIDNSSIIGTEYYEDALTPLGIQVTQSVIMSYSELQFILAEAAQKGLISGEPSAYYYEGISASFAFYGLESGNTYTEQEGVVYSDDSGLEQIGLQKWMSLFYNAEAWFDWRRSGYPQLEPAENNVNDDKIPVRFKYPNTEVSLNTKANEDAITNQGPNTINTHVWWDK